MVISAEMGLIISIPVICLGVIALSVQVQLLAFLFFYQRAALLKGRFLKFKGEILAKYKLSSMRWEFYIWKEAYKHKRIYHIGLERPFADGENEVFKKTFKFKSLAKKEISSFCKVNGIKSYGIVE